MILYHGSNIEIPFPDLKHSRSDVDFGHGFYTTPIFEQAEKWCRKFQRQGKDGIISKYQFYETDVNDLEILKFDTYSEAWLDFILNCRRKVDSSDYDIVSGGVANDKVFNTVELYFDNLIDKNEAIKRLQYEKPNFQICFRTELAIKKLKFLGSTKL